MVSPFEVRRQRNTQIGISCFPQQLGVVQMVSEGELRATVSRMNREKRAFFIVKRQTPGSAPSRQSLQLQLSCLQRRGPRIRGPKNFMQQLSQLRPTLQSFLSFLYSGCCIIKPSSYNYLHLLSLVAAMIDRNLLLFGPLPYRHICALHSPSQNNQTLRIIPSPSDSYWIFWGDGLISSMDLDTLVGINEEHHYAIGGDQDMDVLYCNVNLVPELSDSSSCSPKRR